METGIRERMKDPTPAEAELIRQVEARDAGAPAADALAVFAQTGLPHRRLEEWKWTDFRQKLKQLAPVTPPSTAELEAPEGAIRIGFDGHGWTWPDALPANMEVRTKSADGLRTGAEGHPLGALTASMTGDVRRQDFIEVLVKPGSTPLIMLDYCPDALNTAFGRIRFDVASGASIDVVERYAGSAGLSSCLFECAVHPSGSIRRTLLQVGAPSQAVALTGTVTVGEGGQYRQTALAFGAGICRIETHLQHNGREAEAKLNSVYLPADGYHVDFTSVVTHGAESCTTRQLTKGAVSKGGRGVFQGKFMVPRHVGQFTDADMQHQALLLEEGAEVFAKPELEIYADDVECAHGNTSGQLDELALFYLRQRGIPLSEARALLTEAFVLEALEPANDLVRESLVESARKFLRSQV